MKVNVKVNIDCKKILQSRGLGQSGAAARHLANLVAKHSDKRVIPAGEHQERYRRRDDT